MIFQKAVREQLKVKGAVIGPSGFGKTLAALNLAYGLVKDWDKIAVVDTESDSTKTHVGSTCTGIEIGSFMHGSIDPPYKVDKFIDAIESAEKAGMECLIIDTFTHEWEGEGGIIEWQQELGGQFHHWKKPKASHGKLMKRIQNSSIHIILTVRAKQSYELVQNDKGKMEPQKIGLQPQQSHDFDYDLHVTFMMTGPGQAIVTKERTDGMLLGFDGPINVEVGEMLEKWAVQGEVSERTLLIREINEMRETETIDEVITKFEINVDKKIGNWTMEKLVGLKGYLEKLQEETLEDEVIYDSLRAEGLV